MLDKILSNALSDKYIRFCAIILILVLVLLGVTYIFI